MMTAVVILVLTGGCWMGYRRGFLRSVFKLLMTILSVFISYFLAPVLANWVILATSLDDDLQTSIAAQMESIAEEQVRAQLEQAVGSYGISVTDDMVSAALDTQLTEGQQTDILNQISMPEDVRQALEQDTAANTAGYAARAFYEYVAGCLARMIVRAVVYAGTFLGVSLVLYLLYRILSSVLKMAGLGGMNRVVGAVFGGLWALLYVWIAFLLIRYMVGTSAGTALYGQIQAQAFTAWLDSHNPLLPVAEGVIAKIL